MMLARRVVSVSRTSARAMSSVWSHIEMGPPDPILGVTEAFKVPRPLPRFLCPQWMQCCNTPVTGSWLPAKRRDAFMREV